MTKHQDNLTIVKVHKAPLKRRRTARHPSAGILENVLAYEGSKNVGGFKKVDAHKCEETMKLHRSLWQARRGNHLADLSTKAAVAKHSATETAKTRNNPSTSALLTPSPS